MTGWFSDHILRIMQTIMMGKTWRQEHETADHALHRQEAGKMDADIQLAFSFFSPVRKSNRWAGAAHTQSASSQFS